MIFSHRPLTSWSRYLTSPFALLLWILLIWGGNFALRGYWEPDEARFVYVAHEMVGSGDWLVPHRHGLPYAHKPPLMFWLINLGETIFPEPFGSRLPSLIGLLLSLWAVTGIGTLWRDRATGIRAALVLTSAWLFWSTCGLGQIDGLLTGLELSAVYLLLHHEHYEGERMPWAAFILMGLAVLAKGPVGLLIPLGVYLAIRFSSQTEPHISLVRILIGLVIAIAIPVTWVIACWLNGAPPEYLHELLFTQNVSRAAGELGHRQPFFYFLLQAPLDFMPWTLFLPAAFIRLRKSDTSLLKKLTFWVLFVVVFFSIPSSKRNLYVLLAFPGLALAIAVAWNEIEKTRYCRILAQVIFILASVFLFGFSFVVMFSGSIPAIVHNEAASHALGTLPSWPFFIVLAVALSGLYHLVKFPRKWLTFYALSLGAVFAALGTFVYPALNNVKVPYEIKPLAEKYIPPGGRLLLYDVYGETLALHSGHMGMRCDSDEAMTAAMRNQQNGLAIFLLKKKDTLASLALSARFPQITETGKFSMGSKTYIWCRFQTHESQALPTKQDDK